MSTGAIELTRTADDAVSLYPDLPHGTARLQEGLQRCLTTFWRAAALAVARGAKLAAEETRR